nr:hypothetical protein [Marinicella sp. W31]MDC2876120.1 hypothetical protein [Marinicella sp. W31]
MPGSGGLPVAASRERIVVPDLQRIQRHMLGVAHAGKGEMQAGVQPVVLHPANAVMGAKFDHITLFTATG